MNSGYNFMDSLVPNFEPKRLPPVHYKDQNPNINPNIKMAPIITPMVKERKKKSTEIVGETIPEIVNFVIQEAPNVAVVRKAIKKMILLVEDFNDVNFDLKLT